MALLDDLGATGCRRSDAAQVPDGDDATMDVDVLVTSFQAPQSLLAIMKMRLPDWGISRCGDDLAMSIK